MSDLALFALGLLFAFTLMTLTQRRWSFAGQTPEDYVGTGPQFDLRQRLNGPMVCEGLIYGPLGRVTSRFVADMDVRWSGNVGIMSERFTYDSGTVQDREWRLTLMNDGTIRAEAPDVVGIGHGQQEGGAVALRYKLRLPASAGGHVLSVNDWMYLVPNGNIINRSQFRKFGFKVAELVATMRPAGTV